MEILLHKTGIFFNIKGLGIDTAAEIATNNLVYFLTPNARYIDAKLGSTLVIKNFYPNDTFILNNIINAWNAVGVNGPLPNSLTVYDISIEPIIVNNVNSSVPIVWNGIKTIPANLIIKSNAHLIMNNTSKSVTLATFFKVVTNNIKQDTFLVL